MPQKRRKETRAVNRVRKRRAELELLVSGNKDGGQNMESKTDTKRAKGTTTEDEEDGEQLFAELRQQHLLSRDFLRLPIAASVSSISDISRTTKAVKICDAAEKAHADTKRTKGTTTKEEENGAVKIWPGDDAAEKARELGKELRKQRPKTVVFESKLQLHKLNGKTLSERELAAFLHRQVLGTLNTPNRAGANWLRFEGGRKPLQIILVRVNCDDPEMLRTDNNAKFIDEYFGFKWVRLHQSVRDRHRFWHTISTATHSLRELLIRKIKEFGDPLLSIHIPERKAQLLMSLADMTLARYPFPTSVFDEKTQNPKIRPTRNTYRRVTERSPIFVIDCEMCLTTDQRLELARISMLNEAGETLMDELVKPYNKIIDYITFKSGITEKMLSKVNTRLKDIQKRICALLTDDAILCGHSLENDLLALQLSHPFCIDTSLLFNFSGRAFVRSGLKALADIFLNEKIQNSRQGHCSLQDAMATLKLLKLKLENGLVFGNVALGWNFAKWAADNGMTIHGTRLEKKEQTIETKEEQNSNLVDMETVEEDSEKERAEEKRLEEKKLDEKGSDGNEETESEGKEKKGGDEESLLTDDTAEKEKEIVSLTIEEKTVEMSESEVVNCDGEREGNEKSVPPIETEVAERSTQRQRAEGSTTADEEATTAEFFDFNEAVRIDNAMQKTSTLSDCFKSVHGGRKGKKMLVVGRKMDKFFQKNENCVLKDVDGAVKLSSLCADLAPSLMEFEVALIDLHCPAGMEKRELDEAFRSLTGGMCNNSFCILLMVGLGCREDDKPIMYQRVHQRAMDKCDEGTTGGGTQIKSGQKC
ncbi:hypothetical protein niasHT_030204 [Heterodera trifolii]|uniref:Exonuclease domain-containing protein n=1 Tax=Heterodera trifolii TaxID=157864 RepID=A0ABD2K3I5_9BILA